MGNIFMAVKSARETSITPIPLRIPNYPAPASLNEVQKVIWDDLVSRLGNDWFPPETHTLLEMYCKHVSTAMHLSEKIEESQDLVDYTDYESFKLYSKISDMRDKETRAAVTLATKLRITNQANRVENFKKPVNSPRPWETKDDE